MLVLTRKPGEKLIVSDSIVVTFLGFKGEAIKLGVEAPPEVRILRQELLPHQAAEPTVRAGQAR